MYKNEARHADSKSRNKIEVILVMEENIEDAVMAVKRTADGQPDPKNLKAEVHAPLQQPLNALLWALLQSASRKKK